MVSVTLPCHIDTTNTTKQLSKNVCQNETGAAVTSLTTKCTDNHGGAAQTEVISGALVSGAAAALLASYLCTLQLMMANGQYVEYDSIELEYGEEIDITCM